MAKEVTPKQDDTFVDQETGLVLRSDPFGGDSHDVIGFADPSEWEILEEDFGKIHEWQNTPTLAGTLVNQKTVMIDHDDARGETPTNIYSVIEAPSGERKAFYGNYQLDQALGCPKPENGDKSPYLGRMVLIQWQGKREQGKGGRTLNVYTVAARKAPVEG